MCRRALIVDDDPAIRCELGRLLRLHRLEVFTATNQREAVNAVEVELPDVTFIDLNLENSLDGQGLKVIKTLASLPGANNRIIILMSTNLDCSPGEREKLESEKKIHVDGLLAKPFKTEDVERILKGIV